MQAAAERLTDAKNQIWFTKKGEQTDVGFTPSFLDIIREAWHVLPTTKGSVAEKSPLLSIETNEGLFSIPAPASGAIISFNDKARNFPDQLTADDVICTIGKAKPKAAAAPTHEVWMDELAAPAQPGNTRTGRANGFDAAPLPPRPPRAAERRVVEARTQVRGWDVHPFVLEDEVAQTAPQPPQRMPDDVANTRINRAIENLQQRELERLRQIAQRNAQRAGDNNNN